MNAKDQQRVEDEHLVTELYQQAACEPATFQGQCCKWAAEALERLMKVIDTTEERAQVGERGTEAMPAGL